MFKTFIISSETCQALVSFSHWKGFMFHAQFFDQLDSCLCCFQSVARRVIFVGQYSNFRGHNWPCIHVISNLEHSGQTSLLRDLDFFFLKRSCKHILDATLSLSLPMYCLKQRLFVKSFLRSLFIAILYCWAPPWGTCCTFCPPWATARCSPLSGPTLWLVLMQLGWRPVAPRGY